jgi:hypothetical protein
MKSYLQNDIARNTMYASQDCEGTAALKGALIDNAAGGKLTDLFLIVPIITICALLSRVNFWICPLIA